MCSLPRCANILMPPPNSTGARWIEISSTNPAPIKRLAMAASWKASTVARSSAANAMWKAWLALADPEVRLAPPSEPRCRDAGFHDQLVTQRGKGCRVEALAPLEIRDGNTYVIQHYSHLPRLQDRTDIRKP